MTRAVYVHLLPTLAAPENLAGDTVVVIDVLRATTTMLAALSAGASVVVPCQTVYAARSEAARRSGPVVLGGERGGVKIEGFDLGNSPSEYTPTSIAGRTLVFTTTNGTLALAHCHRARRVLVGALTNRAALVAELAAEPVVHLLCAGTDGHITGEDALAAGAIIEGLLASQPQADLDDQAMLALAAWRWACASPPLVERLAACRGGRNLVALGMDADIAAASALDTVPLVAEFDPAAASIRPLGGLPQAR